MDFCGTKYKLKTSENFEDFLKSLDIGLISRKVALSVSPVTELVKNDDGSFTLIMSTAIKSTRTTFRLGEEFDEERADGVKVKSLVTMEGNVVTQTQRDARGITSKFVRVFGPDDLKVTSTVDGWDGTCFRVYEAIN